MLIKSVYEPEMDKAIKNTEEDVGFEDDWDDAKEEEIRGKIKQLKK